MKVAIIGAGASGLALCTYLGEYPDLFDIHLYEKNAVIGKKLAATGNGHGNLSNKNITQDRYYGLSDKLFSIVSDFHIEELAGKLGILLRTRDELYYPYSESAKSVCDAFLDNLKQNDICLHLETQITDIKVKQNGYLICTNENKQNYVDAIVLCCGGKAGQNLGADGTSFELLKKLDIAYTDLQPVLVPFQTKKPVKSLKGCRFHGTFSLFYNNHKIKEFSGEALLNETGISGISMMQLSRYYDKNKQGTWVVSCNLVDKLDKTVVENYYYQNKHKKNLFDGLLQPKIAAYFNQFKVTGFEEFYERLTHFDFEISGTKGHDFAQVTRGGVCLDQLDDNLMSVQYPNLYICGEMLDVDGDCGGFNLHFAFACAKHVAKHLILKARG